MIVRMTRAARADDDRDDTWRDYAQEIAYMFRRFVDRLTGR